MAKKKGKSKKNKVEPAADSDSDSDSFQDPPSDNLSDHFEKTEEVYLNPDGISQQQAQEAIIEFVAQNCCYGKKPAEELEIVDIKASSAFHYVLETFTEERDTDKKTEPYYGQPIDGKENGKKPKKWDIEMHPPGLFQNNVREREVPHSAKVKGCKDCDEEGEFDCDDCEHTGRRPCTACGATGNVMRLDEAGEMKEFQCGHCNGSGQEICGSCEGDGKLTCEDCDGRGKVKKFKLLTVKWENHVSSYMSKTSDIPETVVSGGSGTEIFRDENAKVFALTSFYESTINSESQRLVEEHSHFSKDAKIMRQRHNLRVIPITEAVCKWNDEKFTAWIYGLEKKVFCPDYPQQCCCGCVIL